MKYPTCLPNHQTRNLISFVYPVSGINMRLRAIQYISHARMHPWKVSLIIHFFFQKHVRILLINYIWGDLIEWSVFFIPRDNISHSPIHRLIVPWRVWQISLRLVIHLVVAGVENLLFLYTCSGVYIYIYVCMCMYIFFYFESLHKSTHSYCGAIFVMEELFPTSRKSSTTTPCSLVCFFPLFLFVSTTFWSITLKH